MKAKFLIFNITMAFFAHSSISSAAISKNEMIKSLGLVKPGETSASELTKILGKPVRSVKESKKREYFFYDIGVGYSSTATVVTQSGVVEYISFLCQDRLADIEKQHQNDVAVKRTLSSSSLGYSGSLSQLSYDNVGKAYLFEPKSGRIRACVRWKPGIKFEEIGS